jgi:hypothetical protein
MGDPSPSEPSLRKIPGLQCYCFGHDTVRLFNCDIGNYSGASGRATTAVLVLHFHETQREVVLGGECTSSNGSVSPTQHHSLNDQFKD